MARTPEQGERLLTIAEFERMPEEDDLPRLVAGQERGQGIGRHAEGVRMRVVDVLVQGGAGRHEFTGRPLRGDVAERESEPLDGQ